MVEGSRPVRYWTGPFGADVFQAQIEELIERFNDENANFELLPYQMELEGKDCTQVKVTYDKAAGDSPDDYYVLLLDPETKLTRRA